MALTPSSVVPAGCGPLNDLLVPDTLPRLTARGEFKTFPTTHRPHQNTRLTHPHTLRIPPHLSPRVPGCRGTETSGRGGASRPFPFPAIVAREAAGDAALAPG